MASALLFLVVTHAAWEAAEMQRLDAGVNGNSTNSEYSSELVRSDDPYTLFGPYDYG